MSTLDRWAPLLASTLAVVACGGNVNLGDRQGVEAIPDDTTPSEQDDPLRVPSQRVLPIAQTDTVTSIAVFKEHLYLGVWLDNAKPGLARCQKDACGRTIGTLPHAAGPVHDLQVVDQRLGVVGGEQSEWIGTLALPAGTDKQVVIEQLPMSNTRPLYGGGYVFWPQNLDQSLYRCALPDCAGGPLQILRFPGVAAYADGDQLFVTNEGAIARIGALGEGPVELLLADATLSPAPQRAWADPPPRPYAMAITTGNGMLYAAVSDSDSSSGEVTLARWPTAGGAREDLLVTKDRVRDMSLFGSELVWLAATDDASGASIVATCLVEACARTHRHLGVVRADLRNVAADEQRIYWVQAKLEQDQRAAYAVSIRSVLRLPVP
jgi:hypothetical protein